MVALFGVASIAIAAQTNPATSNNPLAMYAVRLLTGVALNSRLFADEGLGQW